MDRIICLVGPSGCGKTTVAEALRALNYNCIDSYTDRPKRSENETGHTFVEKGVYESFDDNYKQNQIMAYTNFDGNNYWCEKQQYREKGTSIYVVDVAGVIELKEKVNDAEIIIIHITCDESIRILRMLKRVEDSLKTKKLVEQRVNHDKDKFDIVPCDYAVNGNKPEREVLNNVLNIIISKEKESKNKLQLSVKDIICSGCGKHHPTAGFELRPMVYSGHFEITKNKVRMDDTGSFDVLCECGHWTTVGKTLF